MPTLWASQPSRQLTVLKTWWKSWTNCLHASIGWQRWVPNKIHIQCEGQARGKRKIDTRVKNTLSFCHKNIFSFFYFRGNGNRKFIELFTACLMLMIATVVFTVVIKLNVHHQRFCIDLETQFELFIHCVYWLDCSVKQKQLFSIKSSVRWVL